MSALHTVVPEFATEVEQMLESDGRASLAQQVGSAVIARCTYESADDAGYIYFVRPAVSAHFSKLATPIAETIVFYDDHGFNVDVDHDGHLYGIEMLGRPDVVSKLKAANAL
jgi:uncharacterized protein YuzE